jgi:hypothetical protein
MYVYICVCVCMYVYIPGTSRDSITFPLAGTDLASIRARRTRVRKIKCNRNEMFSEAIQNMKEEYKIRELGEG